MSDNENVIEILQFYSSSKQSISPTPIKTQVNKSVQRMSTDKIVNEIVEMYNDKNKKDQQDIEKDRIRINSFATPSFEENLQKKLNRITNKIQKELKQINQINQDFLEEKDNKQSIENLNNFLEKLNGYCFESQDLSLDDVNYNDKTIQLVQQITQNIQNKGKDQKNYQESFQKKLNQKMLQNYKIKNQQRKIEQYLNQNSDKAFLKSPNMEVKGNKKDKTYIKELLSITDKHLQTYKKQKEKS